MEGVSKIKKAIFLENYWTDFDDKIYVIVTRKTSKKKFFVTFKMKNRGKKNV